MGSSLRAVCFPPIRVPKKHKKKTAIRKITLFEAHMQQKLQFTSCLQGFVNTQSPRHLKTGFLFLSKLSLISFPIKDGKLEKTRAKSPWHHFFEICVFFLAE